MRINQNAVFSNQELASDPKVDTRIHNIEKLAGIRAPDFTTTHRAESNERGVPTSMRTYLNEKLEGSAFRKQ